MRDSRNQRERLLEQHGSLATPQSMRSKTRRITQIAEKANTSLTG